MSVKKGLLVFVFGLFITASGFSQAAHIGIMGTYNPFNPSFWSVGPMLNVTSNYSGNSAGFFRIGMTAGQTTLTYERENPFTSKHEMTEYWQNGFYIDWIFGYAYQLGLGNYLALRFGGDCYFAYSSAYVHSDYNPNWAFNVGLTGIGGLALLPKKSFSINIDACPGFTLNPLKRDLSIFAFILPIRLTAGFYIGPNAKK